MAGDIALAGLTLTAAEWADLAPEVRAELLGVAAGAVELHPDLDEVEGTADLLS
jgi:hypothetical protein